MTVTELIETKRDGKELYPKMIEKLVGDFVAGNIKDYHMAAWLMAVYLRGLSTSELVSLTSAMWKSGASLSRPHRLDYWVDKHSTGGVGDKTSLILVPWVISTARRIFGRGSLRIPMISGRGLGHSGGTLDKLDSVPGFRSQISLENATELLENNDYFMIGQTETLVPADRLLYALRDVTATVDCPPLIVASILSKKLAENLDGLVIDVKFGSGAFMRTYAEGKSLAKRLLEIANHWHLDSVALLTRMNEPLGYKVGNFIEMEECVDFLAGSVREEGLFEVTLNLAKWMLHLGSRKKISLELAEEELRQELEGSRGPLIFFP